MDERGQMDLLPTLVETMGSEVAYRRQLSDKPAQQAEWIIFSMVEGRMLSLRQWNGYSHRGWEMEWEGRLLVEHRPSEMKRGLGGHCVEAGRAIWESRVTSRVCYQTKCMDFGSGSAGRMVNVVNAEGHRVFILSEGWLDPWCNGRTSKWKCCWGLWRTRSGVWGSGHQGQPVYLHPVPF